MVRVSEEAKKVVADIDLDSYLRRKDAVMGTWAAVSLSNCQPVSLQRALNLLKALNMLHMIWVIKMRIG